jgi:hypothetical protein
MMLRPAPPLSAALLATGILAAAAFAAQSVPARTFDAERPDQLPEGFTFASMRQDGPGTWRVRRDGANGFLVHTPNAASTGYGLAIAPDGALRDVVVSARLRLAGGARSGGLVWRYHDAADFHAAILDLVQGELTLFRVTGGNRIILDAEDDLELDASAWHALKVVHDESRIEISLGGIRVFEERDRRYDPKAAAGRAGVMAAGAAEVWFDDLRIEPDRDRR